MGVMSERIEVLVEDRTLSLSNLDKVLWPDVGFTKGEMIDYYTRIAPVLLPHISNRALTVRRFPNGVDGMTFFEKNVSKGAPTWVRTVNLPAPGSTKNRERIDYIVAESLPTLVWLANLAAIELHVPQWSVSPSTRERQTLPVPDLLVFDLDPGPPATSVECAHVALMLRERLGAEGISAVIKTSGSKGLQLYAPVAAERLEATSDFAHQVARELEQAQHDLVVSRMTKSLRPGKVLVDWSQNSPAKTTVAPYSLRAKAVPSVSTPVTWAEIERSAAGGYELRFTAHEVLDRVAAAGDLFAPLLNTDHRPTLS